MKLPTTDTYAANAGFFVSEAIESLALVLDLDEEEKLFHAWRVASLALAFSGSSSATDRTQLFLGGLLHDIGAIGLEDHIVHLLVREEHTPDVRRHPARGAEIIRAIPGLEEAARAVADHHERFDGGGYPRGLRGEAISESSYLLAIADQMETALRTVPAQRRLEAARSLIAGRNGKAWPDAIGDRAIVRLESDPDLLGDLYDPASLDRRVEAVRRDLTPLPSLESSDGLSRVLLNFARVIDAKHHYTAGHSLRVAYVTHQIVALQQGGIRSLDAAWAGLLHDVGKVGIPRRLLDKEGSLSATERVHLKRHTQATFDIVSRIGMLRHLAEPASLHHEQWDGGGYPRGVSGEEIPPLARVLAYADVYDAVRSNRSYRRELSHLNAVELIRHGVGTHFDPALERTAVLVFEECRSEERLQKNLAAFIEGLAPGTAGMDELLRGM